MTDTAPNLDHTISPDAWEAKRGSPGSKLILLLPLASGNIAVFGRDFQLHTVLYDAPSMEELRRLSAELHAKMMAQSRFDAESAFYGEPGAHEMTRDMRNAERRERIERAPIGRPRIVLDESAEL